MTKKIPKFPLSLSTDGSIMLINILYFIQNDTLVIIFDQDWTILNKFIEHVKLNYFRYVINSNFNFNLSKKVKSCMILKVGIFRKNTVKFFT